MSGAHGRARKVCSNHCKKKHYREAVDLRSPTRELEHEGMGKLGCALLPVVGELRGQKGETEKTKRKEPYGKV